MRDYARHGVITPPASSTVDGSHEPGLAHLIPAPVEAYHRNEIANGLRRLCSASELYWNSMSGEEFVAPLGSAWSPAEHVRHLTKSVRAVSRAMSLPKPLLRLLFWGRRRGVSRRSELLIEQYHAALRAGGQAGRFTPSRHLVPGSPDDYRREIVGAHRATIDLLAREVMMWTRRQVDGILLPHPLLGKLTVREMLLFTLYHNLHHVQVVARRRGEYFTDSTPLSGG